MLHCALHPGLVLLLLLLPSLIPGSSARYLPPTDGDTEKAAAILGILDLIALELQRQPFRNSDSTKNTELSWDKTEDRRIVPVHLDTAKKPQPETGAQVVNDVGYFLGQLMR